MAGICSRHLEAVPGCAACHSTPRDLFPDWDARVAEAEAAGLFTCACGFSYYRTTESCPRCNLRRDEPPQLCLTCGQIYSLCGCKVFSPGWDPDKKVPTVAPGKKRS